MNNHAQIVAEILFLLVLMSSGGIYFLMVLELVKSLRVFRGASGIFFAVLTAILMEVVPIVHMLAHCSATDAEPGGRWILDRELWPPLIIGIVTCILVLFIVIISRSPDDEDRTALKET